MRHIMKVLIPALAVSALVSACGGSSAKSSSASTETSAPSAQASSAASGAVVKTASNSKLGATVLVDAQGMTLYHLSGEQNGKFICTSSACEQVWHPLTAQPGSTASGTVASLGTVKRPNGTLQVAYKGMPLYTFANDTAPGQANGQGIKDVGTWSAATTSRATSASAPATTSTESSKGGGYGY